MSGEKITKRLEIGDTVLVEGKFMIVDYDKFKNKKPNKNNPIIRFMTMEEMNKFTLAEMQSNS